MSGKEGTRQIFASIVGTGLAPVRKRVECHHFSDRGKPSPYDIAKQSSRKSNAHLGKDKTLPDPRASDKLMETGIRVLRQLPGSAQN